MDATATLGSILAAALSVPVLTPEQVEQEREDRLHAMAQLQASYALSRQLSVHLGIGEADAWQSICTVPDNLLSLLCSPQGWTAIAGMVAADHGLADPGFMPALN
jgi:hypothetical protein